MKGIEVGDEGISIEGLGMRFDSFQGVRKIVGDFLGWSSDSPLLLDLVIARRLVRTTDEPSALASRLISRRRRRNIVTFFAFGSESFISTATIILFFAFAASSPELALRCLCHAFCVFVLFFLFLERGFGS